MKRLILLCAMAATISACGYGNTDYVKAHADATWASQGYRVTGYQGYEIGPVVPFSRYGGAYVWYQLRQVPDNGITYEGALQRWGDEVHVYSLSAKDAIKP